MGKVMKPKSTRSIMGIRRSPPKGRFAGGTPKEQRILKENHIAKRSERGSGMKFDVAIFQTVASFQPGTRIKYVPNPKTPSSKSYKRYAGYEKSKTVGEALKNGTSVSDLRWELQRNYYKVLGGQRSEAAEKAAIGEKWFAKAKNLLGVAQGPRGLNVNLKDPKAKEALAREEAWREKKLQKVKELAKTHKIKIENEEELSKMGIHEAHELHAERKVCDFICQKKLREADQAKKKITDQDLQDAMSLWGFKQNIGRLNVMREGVKYVYSDTIGAIRARCRGYGITPATAHYPNFVRLLCRWLKDNHLEKKLGCEFKCTAINLNANYAGARHRDGNNEGPSVIRAVGNFKGGKLLYWPKDAKSNMQRPGRHELNKLSKADARVFDLKKNTTIFDGCRAHEVEDFTGDRYSLVYFTASGFMKVPPANIKFLQSVGMPYPSPKAIQELKLATQKFIDGKAAVGSVKRSDKVKKVVLKKSTKK
jgi:hypothetical protein